MQEHILLIEDDKVVRENVRFILESEGYRVTTMSTGHNAVKKIAQSAFQLILCDIMLPGKNGFDIIEELIKKNVAVPPLIFLTAKIERENVRRGMDLGADDYITKPFTRHELLGSVRARLKKAKVSDEALQAVKRGKQQLPAQQSASVKMGYDASLFVDTNEHPALLKIADIVIIRSKGDYSEIITRTKDKLVLRRSMKNWQSSLPAEKFLRIHRSTIVNLECVVTIEKWFNYSYRMFLVGISDPVVVSQRFSKELRSQLRK